MEIYTLRPGQSLERLCRQRGLDPREVAELNQLRDPGRLAPGQCLLLPGPPRPPLAKELAGGLSLGASLPPAEELPRLSWLILRSISFEPGGKLHCFNAGEFSSLASRLGALPILSVASLGPDGFSPELIHGLLSSPQARDCFISGLLQVLKAGGWRGAELDMQYIYGFDRGLYSAFVQELSQALHREGLYLLLALAPQTGEDPLSPLSAGQDMEALAPWGDRILLLARDLDCPGSGPQPPSPIARIRSCLDYALRYIPAPKLLLSLSLSGRSWPLPWRKGDGPRPLSSPLALSLAASQGAAISYDRAGEAAFFTYRSPGGGRRMAWLEDLRSIESRAKLAEELGLGGLELSSLDRPWRPACRYLEQRLGPRALP